MAEQEKKFSINLGNMIGWLFGGLSFLNLIDDFNLIKLRGKIAKWVDAYSQFVQSVNDALFGWIDFYWLRVSDTEAHFLIIISIIVTSTGRTFIRVESELFGSDASIYREATLLTFFTTIICVINLVIFPGIWGMLFVFIELFTMWFIAIALTVALRIDFVIRAFIIEITGVISVFLILVALNYMMALKHFPYK